MCMGGYWGGEGKFLKLHIHSQVLLLSNVLESTVNCAVTFLYQSILLPAPHEWLYWPSVVVFFFSWIFDTNAFESLMQKAYYNLNLFCFGS